MWKSQSFKTTCTHLDTSNTAFIKFALQTKLEIHHNHCLLCFFSKVTKKIHVQTFLFSNTVLHARQNCLSGMLQENGEYLKNRSSTYITEPVVYHKVHSSLKTHIKNNNFFLAWFEFVSVLQHFSFRSRTSWRITLWDHLAQRELRERHFRIII